jgi:hypothetical protein
MVATPAQAAPLDFLTISDAANWEGGNLVFTVTYTGSTDNEAFDFAVIDNTTNATDPSLTASADDHGVATSPYFTGSTITFHTGSTTPQKATVTVPALVAGAADAANETLKLRAIASGGNPATDPTITGTGTIWDLDPNNHIVLGGATTVPETAANGVQKTVTVTAISTNPQQHDVTVPIMTADISTGTYQTTKATSLGGSNRDYTALPPDATITIPANQTQGTATVQLWDDTSDEADTQYFNVAQDTNRATLGGDVLSTQNTVQIGIQDDDATPTISIGDSGTVREGSQLIFPIKLSNPSELGVTATLTATGAATGSAAAAIGAPINTGTEDFLWTNLPGNLAVPPYAASTNVMIPTTTNPPTTFEGPENVRATLSDPSNATLGTPTTANGLITDADAGQTLQWSTLGSTAFDNSTRSWTEGNGGPVDQKIYLQFTSGTLPTTLSYNFVDVTAKNGSDYVGTSGSIAVPASTALNPIVSIPVSIIGDRINEPDETFKLVVTDPSGVANSADIGDVTFTIENDDAPPTWTTQDVSVDEGNTGKSTARVPIMLNAPAAADATFIAVVTDGSATESAAGTGGNDYDPPATSSVTVKAGDTTAYLEIPIVGDDIYERDESLNVMFLAPVGIDDTSPDTVRSSRVTIRNDDALPKMTFGQVSGLEGSFVIVNGTIVGASQYSYDLGFTAAGSGDNPATAGTDFTIPTGLSTSTITIPAGFTGDLNTLPTPFPGVPFVLNSDAVDEPTETFDVTVSEASAALKGFQTSAATVKIADDPLDLPPTVAIGDVSIGEWEKSVDIPVTLSFSKDNDATSTQQAVTVPYWTVDGAAKVGVNYKETQGTLTIPPGTLTAKINVPVMDDGVKSTAKDFFVKLGKPGPAGATLGKDTSQVLIKDSGNGGGTPGNGSPTISAPAWIPGSTLVPVTGKADAGATVDLFGAPWSPAMPKLVKMDSTTADSDGNYKFSRWIGTGYRFQTAVGDAMSDVAKVGLTQSPVFVASSPSRGKLSVAIQGRPRGPKQVVIVQVLRSGKWVNTWRGTTGANNLWKANIYQKSRTSLTLRAFVQGDMNWGVNGGYSPAVKVTIK